MTGIHRLVRDCVPWQVTAKVGGARQGTGAAGWATTGLKRAGPRLDNPSIGKMMQIYGPVSSTRNRPTEVPSGVFMSIKRVALITPPYHCGVVESAGTWLNVGFVYIAGSLRAAGYEVDYYDAMSLWHKWPEIEARIRAFNPDVVATTSFTASVAHALELTALAKKINPDIVTVHGNVHATFCSRRCCRPSMKRSTISSGAKER